MSESARILVVDDQQEIRDLAALVLGRAGWEVATAADGREALERLRSWPADLVLLDINMPGMDGWEALRLLRADTRLDGVKVAMFSVKGEVRDKVLGMQEGALDYITKPFEVDDLVDRVRRILATAGGTPAGCGRE